MALCDERNFQEYELSILQIYYRRYIIIILYYCRTVHRALNAERKKTNKWGLNTCSRSYCCSTYVRFSICVLPYTLPFCPHETLQINLPKHIIITFTISSGHPQNNVSCLEYFWGPIPKGWLSLVENIKTWVQIIPVLSSSYHKIHQYITNIQSENHMYFHFFFFFINFKWCQIIICLIPTLILI